MLFSSTNGNAALFQHSYRNKTKSEISLIKHYSNLIKLNGTNAAQKHAKTAATLTFELRYYDKAIAFLIRTDFFMNINS